MASEVVAVASEAEKEVASEEETEVASEAETEVASEAVIEVTLAEERSCNSTRRPSPLYEHKSIMERVAMKQSTRIRVM